MRQAESRRRVRRVMKIQSRVSYGAIPASTSTGLSAMVCVDPWVESRGVMGNEGRTKKPRKISPLRLQLKTAKTSNAKGSIKPADRMPLDRISRSRELRGRRGSGRRKARQGAVGRTRRSVSGRRENARRENADEGSTSVTSGMRREGRSKRAERGVDSVWVFSGLSARAGVGVGRTLIKDEMARTAYNASTTLIPNLWSSSRGLIQPLGRIAIETLKARSSRCQVNSKTCDRLLSVLFAIAEKPDGPGSDVAFELSDDVSGGRVCLRRRKSMRPGMLQRMYEKRVREERRG